MTDIDHRRIDVRFVPILFSNSGSGCRTLEVYEKPLQTGHFSPRPLIEKGAD